MKIEKITPQIAALYLGQKCDWLHIETEMFGQRVIDGLTVEHVREGAFKITPHLRRLESMTEEEAREVYEIRYGETWEKSFHDINIEVSPCLENFWKEYIELYSPEGSLLIGFPDVWLHLLSKGFDLFGLIDAGLAKEITQ